MKTMISKLTASFAVLLLFTAAVTTANSQEKPRTDEERRRTDGNRRHKPTPVGPGKIDPNTVVAPAGDSVTSPVLGMIYADAVQPANSIKVSIRYRKEYGYSDTASLFVKGPTSCSAFSISAKPTSPVELEYLVGIENASRMTESNGQYVCDLYVKYLPLNREFQVRADVDNSPARLTGAWMGGSEPQPPPGYTRLIRNGIRNVTLTASAPRAVLVFEMVYSPPLIGPR